MQNPLADDLDRVLERTKVLWRELGGKHIFITGGTGFVGSWLLETFVWANEKLKLSACATVLSRNPGAFERKTPHLAGHPSLEWRRGDLSSFHFPSGSFSHIIHAAAETSATLNRRTPAAANSTKRWTTRVLDFAKRQKNAKFLFLSSGAVYGAQPPGLSRMPENFSGGPDPSGPGAAYAEGKRAAELLCMQYGRKYGMQVKIARCFAFAGPYLPLNAHYAVGNFIRDALNGGSIRVRGDGATVRSYLYSADLAAWLWTILLKGRPGRPYNVGSDRAVTIGELASTVAGVFHPRPKIRVEKKAAAGMAGARYVPCVDRARKELGLAQTVGLGQAIQKTVNWNLLIR
ncbi:MAG: NAD-dependent epimerase/dehydratase family protein [Candidatus Omnitrophica bacterium]|nr:NAD-dependent epimerase/dehydratase family protein [Candidatus Omnitrophota bacterium]